jgi:hypothetical protein
MNATKFCRSCSTAKNVAEFGRHAARYDGLQSLCRPCKRAAQNKWYRNNKALHVANVNRRRREAEDGIIRSIIAYLREHPCVDCGEDNLVVLEFDHVRGRKIESVCNMIKQGYGWAKIFAEIQKCEVRCCKCHRIKTAKQFGYRKMLLASAT